MSMTFMFRVIPTSMEIFGVPLDKLQQIFMAEFLGFKIRVLLMQKLPYLA
jgi:hypothetical protein